MFLFYIRFVCKRLRGGSYYTDCLPGNRRLLRSRRFTPTHNSQTRFAPFSRLFGVYLLYNLTYDWRYLEWIRRGWGSAYP